MSDYPPTPELDKLAKVAPLSQKIGEFIDVFLLQEKGLSIGRPHVHDATCRGWDEGRGKYNPRGSDRCETYTNEFVPCSQSLDGLLAEFFEIDMAKIEKERKAVLKHIRSQ